MFDKNLIAEIALVIGLVASQALPAFLLVRARGTEKGFGNMAAIVACLTVAFFSFGALVGAAFYAVCVIFALLFLTPLR